MTARIHEQIRNIIESTPGLTQRGLAAYMRVNPSAVNRLLCGQRKVSAEEIPLIEEYLGVRLLLGKNLASQHLEYAQEVPKQNQMRGFADVHALQAPITYVESAVNTDPFIPVYAIRDGVVMRSEEGILNTVKRLPAQTGSRHAFALYVFTDTMYPRYYMGELIYLHPDHMAGWGKDCVIETKNAGLLLGRMVGQDTQRVRLETLNPLIGYDIQRSDIKGIYVIVGRG